MSTTATMINETDAVNDKVAFLVLSIDGFGNSAKMDPGKVGARAAGGDAVTVAIDGDTEGMVRLSKRLLDSEELRAVRELDGQFRARIRGGSRTVGTAGARYPTPGLSLPSLIRAGVYAIPISSIAQVVAEVTEYSTARAALVNEFVTMYPTRMEEARTLLGANFDEADYPTVPALVRAFAVRWRFIQIGVPRSMASISKELYASEVARAREEGDRLIEASRALLLAEIQGLLAHMMERLAPAEDGKKKTFHRATLPNFLDAIALIRGRDIADVPAIHDALAKMERAVEGIDADYLKDFVPVRAEVAAKFAAIRRDVDAAVIAAPTRRISLPAAKDGGAEVTA